jgi:hypothetical protein
LSASPNAAARSAMETSYQRGRIHEFDATQQTHLARSRPSSASHLPQPVREVVQDKLELARDREEKQSQLKRLNEFNATHSRITRHAQAASSRR